jgi:CBS domain-containing protein
MLNVQPFCVVDECPYLIGVISARDVLRHRHG